MNRLACLFFCLLAGASAQIGNAPASGGFPPPPASHIHDPGQVLERNPQAIKAISDALRSLAATHHYKVYLYVESVFLSSSPQEVAELARRAWVPGNDGITIAFETDTRRIGFGQDISRSLEIEAAPASVPMHEAAAIIDSALRAADKKTSADTYIQGIVTRLAAGYDSYFQKRAVSSRSEQMKRQLIMILGGVCLVSLAVLIVMMNRRSSSSPSGRRMEFPVMNVSERLGAPCGADVVSRSFRNTTHGH